MSTGIFVIQSDIFLRTRTMAFHTSLRIAAPLDGSDANNI